MGDETKTYTPNDDGTISIVVDSKPIRYAKESDLLAVKGSSETKETDFLARIAEVTRTKDETHQQLLQERTAKEQAEVQAKEGATFKTKVGELEVNVVDLTESRKKLEEELTGRVRSSLAEGFGVTEDKIKDKDLTQLRAMEQTLKEAGVGGKAKTPANYDLTRAGGTSSAPTTPLEQSKQELVLAREIQRKKARGDSDYTA